MRGLPAALLLAASGCAQLFGIDETTGPGVDPSRVSLSVQRYSVGASVQKNPQDLAMLMSSWLVDDGAGNFTKTAGEQTASGVWSAPLPTGMPPVLFTLPDLPAPITRLWAMPARDKKAVFAAYEHPNPQEPLPNSSIMLMATLPSGYASNETFRVEAIGAWSSRGLVAADGLPAPDMGITTFTSSLPYASFSKLTNSPMARITSEDVVVVERYVGNQLTGVYQAPPFDQTDGADPITANLVPVPANRPINVTATPAAYEQRYSAVRPAVTGLGQSWIINAAPGWSIGAIGGPRLHAGSVPSAPPLPATADVMTMFGNPYESLDWRSVLQFSTQETRTFMFMGTVATALSASMATTGEPANLSTLDFPPGLPINIRANQVPLSTDGMTVPLDLTKAVTIDAITDKPAATAYEATLYEVTTDGMTVTKTIVVDAVVTGEPKVVLPADLFQVDHWYYVDFHTFQGGFVNAATGDLQTFQLPFTICRADSAIFQVVAP